MITSEQLSRLERRYLPADQQKCVVCGAPLVFSASGEGGGTRYNCSSDDASPSRSTRPLAERLDHYGGSAWRDYGIADMGVVELVRAFRKVLAEGLTELRWAPYQEFGIPDPAAEVPGPPAGAFTVGATGYRGNRIIIYWVQEAGSNG